MTRVVGRFPCLLDGWSLLVGGTKGRLFRVELLCNSQSISFYQTLGYIEVEIYAGRLFSCLHIHILGPCALGVYFIKILALILLSICFTYILLTR